MSVIHVGHIKTEILGRFGGLVDLTDVSNAASDQREMTRLTRSLAAFVLAELGGLDDVVLHRESQTAPEITESTPFISTQLRRTVSSCKQNGFLAETAVLKLETSINSSRESEIFSITISLSSTPKCSSTVRRYLRLSPTQPLDSRWCWLTQVSNHCPIPQRDPLSIFFPK
jgi:hypothetical protein